MKNAMKNTVFCSSLLLALASSSQAAVTITNQWRLGGGSSALADDVGGATLTANATTVSAAGIATGSTSSQDFQNTVGDGPAAQYMTGTTTIGVTSNWGVSVWVNADSIAASESEFLKIGGLNLQTIGGNWTVHEQGVWLTTIPSPAGVVATGVDYQVSYVNQAGAASLYVNGVNLGAVHAVNSGNDVLVGAQNLSGNIVKGWDGRIDEITLFTFEAGKFVDSDLNTFAIPEPSSSLLGLGSLGLLLFRRKR